MTDKFNVKKIMEMAGYGRAPVAEEGNYSLDYSMNATGRDHYQVNQMGDNPLPLIEETEITDMMVSDLKDLLNNAGKTDEEIALGDVTIKPTSAAKFAKELTAEPVADPVKFVNAVMMKLQDALAGRTDEQDINEFQEQPAGVRFAHDIDTLGNLNITDAHTGKSILLKGQDALEAIGEIEMYGGDDAKIQEILSQYQHVMEDGEAESEMVAEDVDGGRLHEIEPDVRNIQRKLNRMAGEAERDGDLMTAFAANLFLGKFKELDEALADYLRTGKVQR